MIPEESAAYLFIFFFASIIFRQAYEGPMRGLLKGTSWGCLIWCSKKAHYHVANCEFHDNFLDDNDVVDYAAHFCCFIINDFVDVAAIAWADNKDNTLRWKM